MEFFPHLGWHVDKGSHILDPGEGAGIDHQSFAGKGQGAGMPGLENMIHRIYARVLGFFVQTARADKDAEDLET